MCFHLIVKVLFCLDHETVLLAEGRDDVPYVVSVVKLDALQFRLERDVNRDKGFWS